LAQVRPPGSHSDFFQPRHSLRSKARCSFAPVHVTMHFEDYCIVSDEYPVQQCKLRIREMVQSLKTKIGSIRAVGRYHQEGTRTLGKDYAVKKHVLGVGMNGVVRLANGYNSRKDMRFAVKTYDLRKIIARKGEAQLLEELEIHMTVDHPHIVPLVDIYEARSELHLVMECMDGGELHEALMKTKIPSDADAAEIIRQILFAVVYLHGKNIVHRDLKPENFLYEKSAGSCLKLIDFGFSTWWKEGDESLDAPCGTLSYIAPEVLNKSYTKQCDLWSVGVIAFTLVGGHLPFDGSRSAVISNIKACEYAMDGEQWKSVSDNARAFVSALMTPDYQQRLTAHAALEHPWLLEAQNKLQIPDISGFVIRGLRNYKQASRLQRVCCSIACLSPVYAPVCSKVHSYFMAMDTSRSGTVNLEDFKAALSGKLGCPDEEEELLENFFAALDEDDTGRVQYSAFLAAMELVSGQFRQGRTDEIFRRFDAKNTSYINKKSAQELLSNISQKDENVSLLLKDLELDGRGRISHHTFEACLEQDPDTRAAGHVPGHQKEIVKRRPSEDLREMLQKVQSKIGSHWEKLATLVQHEYVVHSETVYFEIFDQHIVSAANVEKNMGIV